MRHRSLTFTAAAACVVVFAPGRAAGQAFSPAAKTAAPAKGYVSAPHG